MVETQSDLVLLSNYTANPSSFFPQEDIYRIYSTQSYFNISGQIESHLDYNYRFLINFRKNLFENKRNREDLLCEILGFESSYIGKSNLVRGDIQILKGHLYHQLGNFNAASMLHLEASKYFQLYGDNYRGLKAITNSKIMESNSTTSYESGELYILLKTTLRNNYYDLAGNIYRGLAIEQFKQAKYAEARISVDQSLHYYNMLSYPDDEAISKCLSSLIWLQLGEIDRAKTEYNSITIYSRKLHSYLEAVKACLSGNQPTLPPSHPLANSHWNHFQLRNRSILFKIIDFLKTGPRSRDEIIFNIWGENALSESYCNRLYVALNQIKKRKLAFISFNGEKYEIKIVDNLNNF